MRLRNICARNLAIIKAKRGTIPAATMVLVAAGVEMPVLANIAAAVAFSRTAEMALAIISMVAAAAVGLAVMVAMLLLKVAAVAAATARKSWLATAAAVAAKAVLAMVPVAAVVTAHRKAAQARPEFAL